MSAPRGKIDVIRLDTLLWALGGSANLPESATDAHALPEALWREIERLASLPRCPYGAAAQLAKQWGKSRQAIKAHIYAYRHKQTLQPRRTHCKRGHPLAEAYVSIRRTGHCQRTCRKCRYLRHKSYYGIGEARQPARTGRP